MKKVYLLIGCFILSSFVSAQTPVISLDGVDDYVDLGPNVGNNARTIEFWFRPATDIDSTLSEFQALIVREVSATNEDDWDIHFNKTGLALPAGAIRFTVHESVGVRYEINSDSRSWNSGQWYHLAAVIDPLQGMMMFIDGVKQTETLATYTLSTPVASANTEVGRWGVNGRHFAGEIDDVRISANSIYTSNFTPPCPDIPTNSSTLGLWNFNENSGSIAVDSSVNNYDATIYGATWDTSFICTPVGVADDLGNIEGDIQLYPNPTSGIVNFSVAKSTQQTLQIVVYNSLGKVIIDKTVTSGQFSIDLSKVSSGIYHYSVMSQSETVHAGKILRD